MIYLAPSLAERRPPSAVAKRPALTALAMLAAANPEVADQLMRDPLGAAQAHPHYPIQLNEDERRLLIDIHARAGSLTEFLVQIADAVEATR